MSFLLAYAVIFISRVIDVTLGTFRTLMVVQGRRVQAAVIGFFEITIYVMALSQVVNNLDNPLNLLSYSLGYACGNYLGITIENKIALGNLSVQIILKTSNSREFMELLRENGFGVTVLSGQGLEGTKEILNLVIKRKDLKNLRKIVAEHDEKAFITVNTINPISGGYFAGAKKK